MMGNTETKKQEYLWCIS